MVIHSTKTTICVVPMGRVAEIVPKAIAANILGYLHINTDIVPSLEQPQYAFDESRIQYNAGEILKAFESMPFHNYEKVIGILDLDLFVPIFSYVFGEARQAGKYALVSLYRLQKNLDGSTPSMSLFLERAAKVALHELGHLFNLIHCEDENCLMHFSGGLQDLDNASFYFCRYCSTYFRDALSIDRTKGKNTRPERDS